VNLDKLQWFKFSPTDWIMGKIQRCPDDTQGRYMRLVCLYWNKECILSIEDAEIEIDTDHLDILTKKKIIKTENDFIKISFLDEQMESILETSKKNSLSAKKRWSKSDAVEVNSYTVVSEKHATVIPKSNVAMRSHENAMPNHADKIREEEIRKENIINNAVFVSECKNSTQWIEVTAMQNKVSPEIVNVFLTTFENHLITMQEQKKTVKEYKEHFTHWMKKQDLSNFREKIVGKTNQI
jgi:hypothetical protein